MDAVVVQEKRRPVCHRRNREFRDLRRRQKSTVRRLPGSCRTASAGATRQRVPLGRLRHRVLVVALRQTGRLAWTWGARWQVQDLAARRSSMASRMASTCPSAAGATTLNERKPNPTSKSDLVLPDPISKGWRERHDTDDGAATAWVSASNCTQVPWKSAR